MIRCASCGYDLAGRLAGERCPECGQAIPDIALRGGLAAGGAVHARPAARIATVIAVLVGIAAACGLVVQVANLSPRLEAVLWTAWQQGRYVGLLLGAYLGTLVARMCVPDSPWSRLIWLAAAARLGWGLVCEAVVNPFVVPPLFLLDVMSAEIPVSLALDCVVALGVVHVGRTGGVSRASVVAAWVAAGFAAYGFAALKWRLPVDAMGLLSTTLSSGLPGAIACALALRRIEAELVHGRRAESGGEG